MNFKGGYVSNTKFGNPYEGNKFTGLTLLGGRCSLNSNPKLLWKGPCGNDNEQKCTPANSENYTEFFQAIREDPQYFSMLKQLARIVPLLSRFLF